MFADSFLMGKSSFTSSGILGYGINKMNSECFHFFSRTDYMKDSLSRKCFLLLCILAGFFHDSFSLEWEGKFSYAALPAPSLKNPGSVQEALHSSKFLNRVGGMIFDQIAAPVEGLKIESLSLGYASENEDGRRLNLIVNGKKVGVLLYDWQLAPIARYADTPWNSCLSPYGSLNDKDREKKVLDARGVIMNYHPAFERTLLGLRLFHMYNLVLHNHSIRLPKVAGSYLLGRGEQEPDVEANRKGFLNFAGFYQKMNKEMNQNPRSLVISDFSRTPAFSVQDNVLKISGTPYFFFWRFQSDQPDYNPGSVGDAVREEINRQKFRNPLFNENPWLISAILKLAREYQDKYALPLQGSVEELLKLQSDGQKQAFLERLGSEELFNLLVAIRERMEAYSAAHLERYSQEISNRPDLLRSINPPVWDAALNTMRYAAFFRYCRKNFPGEWKTFMEKIKDVSAEPLAETPTVTIWGQTP